MMGLWILVATAAASASADPATARPHTLAKGRVTFSVPATWTQIDPKGIEGIGFQIPNPADQGTPDSANLAVTFQVNPGHPFGESLRNAGAEIKAHGGELVMKVPKTSLQDAVLLFHVRQGSMPYIIIDRLARRSDIEVHVRASWPLLPKTTDQWLADLLSQVNRLMETTAVDGVALGKAGSAVARTITQAGKPVSLLELVE